MNVRTQDSEKTLFSYEQIRKKLSYNHHLVVEYATPKDPVKLTDENNNVIEQPKDEQQNNQQTVIKVSPVNINIHLTKVSTKAPDANNKNENKGDHSLFLEFETANRKGHEIYKYEKEIKGIRYYSLASEFVRDKTEAEKSKDEEKKNVAENLTYSNNNADQKKIYSINSGQESQNSESNNRTSFFTVINKIKTFFFGSTYKPSTVKAAPAISSQSTNRTNTKTNVPFSRNFIAPPKEYGFSFFNNANKNKTDNKSPKKIGSNKDYYANTRKMLEVNRTIKFSPFSFKL